MVDFGSSMSVQALQKKLEVCPHSITVLLLLLLLNLLAE
jgi:hypothetical protein